MDIYPCSSNVTAMHNSTVLRERLAQDEIIITPGVHDSLTARVADRVGFDALYMTGHGTSLSKTGYPDAGLVTMTEMVENAKHIQQTANVPLICDADNGYGNATNVIRTVREFTLADVAAIQMEDQAAPKRCGHASGRRVISKEEAVGKYRAAADERDEHDEDLVIIARSDARGAAGGSLDEAIDRVNAYCEAGADVAFVEGPVDETEVKRIGEEVEAPLMYNCVGISPRLDPVELEELGYEIVIYPVASTFPVIHSVFQHLSDIKEGGRENASTVDLRFEEERFEALPIETEFDDTATGKFFEFGGFPEIYGWEEQYLLHEEDEKYDDAVGVDISAKGDE
jgi:2-methylisocitrate lyase-like PEP mutase family enzyme